MVFKSANMIKGADESSQRDAEQHCRFLMSKKQQNENKELRVQLATSAWLLPTEFLDPNNLEVFVV